VGPSARSTTSDDGYGRWIRRRVYLDCPGGHGYTDFEPGRLDQERNVDVRTCDDRGATVETEPYVTTRPNEATTTNLIYAVSKK
jgi:hypothetical protein